MFLWQPAIICIAFPNVGCIGCFGSCCFCGLWLGCKLDCLHKQFCLLSWYGPSFLSLLFACCRRRRSPSNAIRRVRPHCICCLPQGRCALVGAAAPGIVRSRVACSLSFGQEGPLVTAVVSVVTFGSPAPRVAVCFSWSLSYCVFLKAPSGGSSHPGGVVKSLSYWVFLKAPVGGSGHPEGDPALDVFSGLLPPLLCARVCG